MNTSWPCVHFCSFPAVFLPTTVGQSQLGSSYQTTHRTRHKVQQLELLWAEVGRSYPQETGLLLGPALQMTSSVVSLPNHCCFSPLLNIQLLLSHYFLMCFYHGLKTFMSTYGLKKSIGKVALLEKYLEEAPLLFSPSEATTSRPLTHGGQAYIREQGPTAPQ